MNKQRRWLCIRRSVNQTEIFVTAASKAEAQRKLDAGLGEIGESTVYPDGVRVYFAISEAAGKEAP